MKYLLMILLLCTGFANADTKRIDAVNRVAITCKGAYASVPNGVNGIDLAVQLAESNKCKTQYQGNVYVEYYAASSRSSSVSSKAASSVSSSRSSAQSSVSSSAPIARVCEKSTVAGLVNLCITCPNQRENGQALALSEIKQYWMIRAGDRNEKFASAACSFQYATTAPAEGETFRVAVEDVNGIYSKFVPVEM